MSVEFEDLLKVWENPSEQAWNLEHGRGGVHRWREIWLLPCYPWLLTSNTLTWRSWERLDYIIYLSIFDELFDIPRERNNIKYEIPRDVSWPPTRLHRLSEAAPILEWIFRKICNELEKWENGVFLGWPKRQAVPWLVLDPILTCLHSFLGKSWPPLVCTD